MKSISLAIILTACAATLAQTPPKAASSPKAASVPTTGVKLPPGVPPARGLVKTAFSLRYQDIKIGTGSEAEPNEIYKVLYTGWLAADGHKFDSSEDHRMPVMGPDGKPVMGPDGKPKLGDPQPLTFPQGFGRLIPGFDQGFTGMKVGGKRRLFIPWQLAYGARGVPTRDPAHPGIPPKSDLIFDIELVDVTDMPAAPNRPGMMPGRPGVPMPPGHPATPSPQGAPPQSGAPGNATTPPPATPPATQPATPAQPAQPATPPKPQTKQ
jgi:peptidylprolyl isomerase